MKKWLIILIIILTILAVALLYYLKFPFPIATGATDKIEHLFQSGIQKGLFGGN